MRCPKCKSKRVVLLLYGLLTLIGRKNCTEGKAHWAGEERKKGMPDLHCKACGHEFSEEEKAQVEKKRTRSEAAQAAWAKHRDKIMAGMKKAAEKKAEKIKS